MSQYLVSETKGAVILGGNVKGTKLPTITGKK